MPQVALLIIAGAGAYAGARWLGRTLRRQAEAAAKAATEMRARAEAGAIRDLGALEWDETAGVYRPRSR